MRKQLFLSVLFGGIIAAIASPGFAENPVNTPGGAMRPDIRGMNVAVSAPDHYAAQAAIEVFKKGGNAVDAGVAATLVAKVTQHCHTSWGGDTPIMIHQAEGGHTTFISGIGPAPQMATLDYFEKIHKGIPVEDSIDIAPVPGSLAGLALALEKYGKLTWKEVMAPAIRLAREGFPISPIQVKWLEKYGDNYVKWPESKNLFMPKNRVMKVGEPLVHEDMADMMENILKAEAKAGNRTGGIQAAVDYFYKGPVAKEIERFMKDTPNAGLLRYDDFTKFIDTVKLEYEPLRAEYTSADGTKYEILTTNTLTQGPTLLMVLNILDETDFSQIEQDSAAYLHLIAETIKLVMADRYRYFGDPDVVSVPEKDLISKEYAKIRGTLIDMKKAAPNYRPGDPWSMKAYADAAPSAYAKADATPGEWEGGTVQLAVMDKEGNMFSATSSNAMGIGTAGAVPGEVGFLLGGQLRLFYTDPESANQLAPFKRPRLTAAPALVLKNGKPWMAFGTPGGDQQVQTMLQIFLNIVEYGMAPQAAVERYRIRSFAFPRAHYPGEVLDNQLGIGDMASPDVIGGLAKMGHIVKVENTWLEPYGGACVVLREDGSEALAAAADPRRECYALGY